MKSFILKTIILLLTLTTLFFFILLRADGATDPFYLRFTTPKKTNLILGTSKSAQGLQPSVIQKKINGNFFNYSFTDAHSPFGPVYLKSIKKKLNRDTMDGIFIVTVDPWSISSRTKNPNDIENFRENNLSLAQTKYVNIYPNCEYLIENFKGKYYKILTTSSNTMFLHSNGWLEVSVPMDSISVKKRLNNKLETYKREMLPSYKFSSVRLGYLKKTIEFLKLHGKVYMVRLPIHPRMFEIESRLLPEFNEILAPILKLSDGYLDMTNENNMYQYTDGNHLYKESGKLVSVKIAEWINDK